MAAFDIFRQKAFSMLDLSSAVNAVPTNPQFLGSLNLFAPKPIATTTAAIEIREQELFLIPASLRGSKLEEGQTDKRKLFYQDTLRIAKGQTITATEIQNVRAFGSTSELQAAVNLVADRLTGPTGLVAQVDYTLEFMRLGAIQGKVLDATGATLVDWFSVLGQVEPSEIDFDLDNASPASGAVRKKCSEVVRGVQRKLGGLWMPGSYLVGLCGDAFWDDLTAHSEIRQTYLNTQEAASLRGPIAFEQFTYGGITFINYRGSDDGSTIAIGTDKCRFVPVNVPGLFEMAYSPLESFEFANTPGQPLYSMLVMDDDRQMWVRPEVYSYPLPIVTRPQALYGAKRT